jgi:hypothetical protein
MSPLQAKAKRRAHPSVSSRRAKENLMSRITKSAVQTDSEPSHSDPAQRWSTERGHKRKTTGSVPGGTKASDLCRHPKLGRQALRCALAS